MSHEIPEIIPVPDTFIPENEIDRKDAIERKRKKVKKPVVKKGNLKAYERATTKQEYRTVKRTKVIENGEVFEELENPSDLENFEVSDVYSD